MKALPQLLSCLIIASAALLNSSAAVSSDVPVNEELSKSSAGATHKKAKKSPRRAKTAQKKARKYHVTAQPVAQASVSVVAPVVAENAYLPSSTAPVVAKPNVYLPAATTATVTPPPIVAVAPAVPAAIVTTPLAASKVMTAKVSSPEVPKNIPATPAAPLILSKSLTLTSVAASAPVVAEKTPVVVEKSPVVAEKAPVVTEKAPVVAEQAPVAAHAAPAVAVTTPPSNPWNTGVAANARAQPRKADTIIARSTNPYLAYNAAYSQPYAAFNPGESLGQLLSGIMFALPSLPSFSQPSQAAFNQTPAASNPAAATELHQIFNSLRNYLPEPHLPSPDIDILPSITKVYPTGERPLYVLTFKCPTELVGITPPPTKALRWLISSGMEAINSTNLLSFSMQQVCQ
ncbi:MAG: hypothetical protein PHD37_11135 [Gallionellaceae bacterium]|nr:hypothetical protein [Gallionellaceae bacterium]